LGGFMVECSDTTRAPRFVRPLLCQTAKKDQGSGFFSALTQNHVKCLSVLYSGTFLVPGQSPNRYTHLMGKNGDSTFSRNLRRLRKKRGLTQYDLADMTGISRRMIGHYETHAVQPPIENLEIIAKALKVKTAELLVDDKVESENEIDPSQFDSRSLKRLKDILSLSQTDRSDLYRMLNRMLRENREKQEVADK
jgi:transcriptional regulator with XRE-family HTH domain